MMYRYALPVLAAASTALATATTTAQVFFGGDQGGPPLYGSVIREDSSSTILEVSCANITSTATSSGAAITAIAQPTGDYGSDPNACYLGDTALTITIASDLFMFSSSFDGTAALESCTWAGTTGTATCSYSASDPTDGVVMQVTSYPPANVTLAPIYITAGATSATTTSSSSHSGSKGTSSGAAGQTGSVAPSGSSSHNAAAPLITVGPRLAVAGGLLFGAMAL